MKLNVIRYNVKGGVLLIGATMLLAGCQREDMDKPGVLSGKDGIVKFEPSIGGILSGVKSSASEDAASTFTQSLALSSEDGSFTLPMNLSVTSMEACVSTKATLINENGGITDADFAEAVGNAFWVSAWDDATTPAQIIPDETAKNFTGGYVSTDGLYQKVMYRDGVDGSHYWMTVQPQISGFTGPADDEYIWKKNETKTFYAYANVPRSGATIEVDGSSQTLTYKLPAMAADQTDILLGCSDKGETGETGATGSEKMTGTASLKFNHPLTAVRFKLGEMENVAGIKSISISGLASRGTVTMTANADGNIGSWVVAPTEEYKAEVTLADGDNLLEVDGTTKLIGLDSEGKYNGAFLLIPQDLSDHKVTVTAVLTTEDGDVVTVCADITSGTWLAGKINTYTLGLAEDYLLPGIFNVGTDSDPQYVRFTKGNLQANYNDGDPKWRFAKNQYDIIGDQDISEYNTRTDGSYPWYDLFGWGATGKATSGATPVPFWENGGNPVANGSATEQAKFRKDINTNGAVLSPDDDWGANIVGNAAAKTFQTLTNTQWRNLLNKYAPKKSSITIDGSEHYGMVIQPSGTPKASYTLSEWKIAEKNGAVFFPSAGYRNGNTSENYNSKADENGFFYWSRTLSNDIGGEQTGQTTYKLPYGFGVYDNGTSYTMINWRSTGRPVRLVELQ